jgi:predicted TIM-barrel fold metal-dependent hydrolase
MKRTITRRTLISGAIGVLPGWAGSRPAGLLIDTHIHLFADDQKRFPYHRNAVYRPPAAPLEPYVEFVRKARIDHTIIIHPEPYQDDHTYLEYCFAREPSPGFFKGTCLFDPIASDTPARMQAIVEKYPGRIVAMRIHETHEPGTPPTTTGAIRDRDLRDPAMKNVFRIAQALGIAIQFHFIPAYAPQIYDLASQFPEVPIMLDHLGRPGQGKPEEYAEVLKLAKLPKAYVKLCAVPSASKAEFPHRDVQPVVRRAYDAFGPDRFVWGGMGHSIEEFGRMIDLFETMFDFLDEAGKAKIRGQNAAKLFDFKP